MPEAIAGAIAYYVTGTFTYGAAAYIGYGYAIAFAASAAYAGYAKRKADAKARGASNANAKDREVMVRSAIMPRRFVYGRDRISGPVAFMQSTGDKGQYLHVVVALAAHECDAIEKVYFNEVELPDPDVDGYITSGEFAPGSTNEEDFSTQVTNGSGEMTLPHNAVAVLSAYIVSGSGENVEHTNLNFTHTTGTALVTDLPATTQVTVTYTRTVSAGARVRIKMHLGGSGQTADSTLVSESGGLWTNDHDGAGICYLYVRLEYDQEIFGSVGIPNISALVRGKKVYDPRTDTTVWSNNAALCSADFLKSSEGMRATDAEVPDSEVITAANICDEEVDLSDSNAAIQLRYTADLSFTTDISPRDVLGDLLICMAGRAVWTEGRWLLRAGAHRTPALTITADMLCGPISIAPRASRTELFNAVRATYRDPEQGYAEVQAPLVENSQYEAEDGDVQIVRHIDIPTLCDTYRAQRLAKIELERHRQALTVRQSTNLKAYDLAPTDTTNLNLAQYGWTAKVFEVAERTLNRDGTIGYTLRETAAGVWDWNFGEATVGDLAPNTELTSPYARPAALENLTITQSVQVMSDGGVRIEALLEWDQSENTFVVGGGAIDVQWGRIDEPLANSFKVAGDSVAAVLAPLDGLKIYRARIRAVTAVGRTGDWSYISWTAIDDDIPPEDMTGFAWAIKPGLVQITCDPCIARDYAATELRYMTEPPGSDAGDWDDAIFLVRGKNNEYHHPRPPNGTYYVLGKHIDTTGNYSANPAYITVIVDDSIDFMGAGTLVLRASRFPYFLFSTGTTHTPLAPGDTDILFTAILIGLRGNPLFTAEAFDADEVSLGTFELTSTGVTCILTVAQFVSLGTSGSVRYLDVTATLAGAIDTLRVYRQDPTVTEPRMYLDNPLHQVSTDENGDFGDYTGALTGVVVFEGVDDTTVNWDFSITPDAGLTATINGEAGPISGEAEIEVAVSDSTVSDGVVVIDAESGTDDALQGVFRVIKRPASGSAYTAYFDPRTEILLPVNIDGSVASFSEAWTDYRIMRGTLDDTDNWSLSKEDLGVTSTLTDNRVQITAFTGLGSLGEPIVSDLTPATGWESASSAVWCDSVWVIFGYHSAADYSTVLRSFDFETFAETDTGDDGNWTRGAYGTNGKLIAIEEGVSSNRVLVSLDKGLTWALDTISETASWGHIHFGDGFMVAAAGSTAGSFSDDGDTWADITMPAANCALAFAAPVWSAVSPAGNLYVSTDSGTTWSSAKNGDMELPAGNEVHVCVGFLGALVAALRDSTDQIKISIDSGVTWFTVITPAAYSAPSMLIVIRNVLYLVSDDLSILFTDNGLNWSVADEPFGAGGLTADGIYGMSDSAGIDYLPAIGPAEAEASTGIDFAKSATPGTAVAVPAHAAGDWIVVFLRASAAGVPPLAISGYTDIANSGTTSFSSPWRLMYQVDTTNAITTVTSGSASNTIFVHIMRGMTAIGDVAVEAETASSSGVIPALTLENTDGSSVVFAAFSSNQGFVVSTLAGLTLRLDNVGLGGGDLRSWDTDIGVASFAGGTPTWTGGGALWTSVAVEFKGAASSGEALYKQPLLGTSETMGFVQVTGTKVGELPLTRNLPVRKGVAAPEVFTSHAVPAFLALPSTSDGYVTDFSDATITGYIRGRGGREATDEYSWTWTATNLTPSSGSTNAATFTAMDPAEDFGTVTFVAECPGRPQINGTVEVRKLRGQQTSGPVPNAIFNAFSFVDTYVALRFGTDGSYSIKVGSGGSFGVIGRWSGAPGTQNTNFWVRVDATGHALTSGTTGTWLQMSANRDYVLSDATSGTHRTDLIVSFAVDNVGTDAVSAIGALQLIVP